jgi:hypothetical protein
VECGPASYESIRRCLKVLGYGPEKKLDGRVTDRPYGMKLTDTVANDDLSPDEMEAMWKRVDDDFLK